MKKKKIQKTNAMRVLENYRINYDVHEYAWNEEHTDAKTAADKVAMPFQKVYKTLVAVGNITGVIVACIPASNELDLKKFAKASGNKKVDMLHMKDLEKTTGYIRGGCSPVGMKKLFPTYIAAEAEAMETIIVSAGKRGMQMELPTGDLIEVTSGDFADITE
ncbi:Cys-tRNA(Pro)/Cys-tRNA(Cys) deacylase [Jeotgalicoccus coquinae]|mgnify:FL=1|uniref:Cys-tRNA(Pro)/Cys-tRNA(Cys) deacylase n=1 Tax=Jeotgalicoccus coquinae TaxID=709509 RepID=A0A6V7RNT2_9STAP|nr:Cys-tRNA(Pro) deacylase [Jeotgalicoccus coquinae]MBB6422106.1 Cys-tRNA(Pro)/Cys-tRNA(Cys) deacylase [Jeotgalicoccus coquinae]GGE18601.1 Cys-tRNA(Pro)/Cys-tRNA(Cys) deacylase [Jeotgalicoccus coquinae]CAD2079728.1 Cys-tRNA(Pro)/Cys-tRNA(Cys) deacylase YbaK [Jeotgalicoccus coquinae]